MLLLPGMGKNVARYTFPGNLGFWRENLLVQIPWGTLYESGCSNVPQTRVAKSTPQVYQWPFFLYKCWYVGPLIKIFLQFASNWPKFQQMM